MLSGAYSSIGDAAVSAGSRLKALRILGVIAFLLTVGFLLHLPSELGASLAIPPDSNEYALGLANLFEHGKFGFTLNGEWYPSRYAPWFSLTCLTPAYFLFGGDVLSLQWATLAFALLFLVLSCRIGRMAGLGRWSYLCPIIPMFIPDFVFYSRLVMTEIPYTAIFALSAIVFVKFAEDESPSFKFCLGAGALVAWCGAVRASALPMLLPFAAAAILKKHEWKRKLLTAALLAVPSGIYLIANAAYNKCTFGSFFRNGYHFWTSVPSDFFDLTFNFGYAAENACEYLREPVTLIALSLSTVIAVVSLLVLRGRFGGIARNKGFLLLSTYVLFQGIVLFTLYIGYYWCDVRFFLPVMLCAIPLFLAAIATVCGSRKRLAASLMLAVALACMADFRLVTPRYSFMAHYPIRIAEAGISRAAVPSGAVVIQECNPLFMDYFGYVDKKIEHLPIFRTFDYTNAMIAPTSIAEQDEKPLNWRHRIINGLVSSGVCRLPFPVVLSESADCVRRHLENGRRVFLHFGIGSFGRGMDPDTIFKRLDDAGLRAVEFGAWSVPYIAPNPVRGLYDSFIFPAFRMDMRPEVQCIYYEILPK